MTLWENDVSDDRRAEARELRHVERDEQLEFGFSSCIVCVRDSRRLPIVTPDVKGKPIDAMCQRQGDVFMAS